MGKNMIYQTCDKTKEKQLKWKPKPPPKAQTIINPNFTKYISYTSFSDVTYHAAVLSD